ncbi:hypothetical protein LCGC14_2780670 [marine sediment metagenome]|uniref:Uncharacterized protein n=1 Tax=marine sediment metagenome TaxID=412755 RepID=A0A0F9B227_9ZZZZ
MSRFAPTQEVGIILDFDPLIVDQPLQVRTDGCATDPQSPAELHHAVEAEQFFAALTELDWRQQIQRALHELAVERAGGGHAAEVNRPWIGAAHG